MELLNKAKTTIRHFIPDFLIDFYHFSLAFTGAVLYGFPSKRLKVIAVTGTNGKSTTIEMVYQILTRAGFKTSAFSSINFRIGNQKEENVLKMTMPGRFMLQKLLKRAAEAGCKYALLEVTSEGIKQYRHRFIHFQTAVFTNLSPEHIEAHGSFENYRRAKEELFKITSNTHILNLDDENVAHFLKYKAGRKYGYGLADSSKQLAVSDVKYRVLATNSKASQNGIEFEVNSTSFKLNLLGAFNTYNALAAICVGRSEGISLEICSEALVKLKTIPGRMEAVISNPFTVIVDYAFTPNALEKVYQTIKKAQHTKLICVLGAAGGGRDKWKRPKLGELAGRYCQHIIVTNEDPYDEDPMEIINQVAEGVGAKAEKIIDRREAISKALRYAKPQDTVIVTGKGCEPWICGANGKKIAWDDRRIVREEAAKIKNVIAANAPIPFL